MSGAKRKSISSFPLFVIAVPAGVAVWSGWVGLGQMTGFGVVHPLPGIADNFTINSAITLPIGVEAYAAYAMRVWFAGTGIPQRARRFAQRSAIASLLLGIAGQVAYHLMEALGMTRAHWSVTMLVACLPVCTFGMAMSLAHLLHSADDPVTPGQADDHPNIPEGAQGAVDHPDENPVVDLLPAPVDVVADPGRPDPIGPEPAVPAPVVSGQVTPDSCHGRPGAGPRRLSGNAELVRRLVTEHPGASISELATLAKLSRGTVRKYRSDPDAPGRAPDPGQITGTWMNQPISVTRVNGKVPVLAGPEVTR